MNKITPRLALNLYVGTFLIAFSTLTIEITLTRLLSVISWYYLAFFAVAVALLGMTAGATFVFIKQDYFTSEKVIDNISKACLACAASIPISLILVCIIPFKITKTIMSLFALFIGTFAASIPFFFSGIVVTAVLTRVSLPIGKLYASDLIGAALGCIFVLAGLEIFDAPSLIIFSGAIAALAGWTFSRSSNTFKYKRLAIYLSFILTTLAVVNSSTVYGIRPFVINGLVRSAGQFEREEWNSFSMVTISRVVKLHPRYWGPSPHAPADPINQRILQIDKKSGTRMEEFKTLEDIDHLRYDVTNFVHYLRPKGPVCVLGVGGGRDVQSALLFGHEKIVGVELNPILTKYLEKTYRNFAGIADRPEVKLVTDEARAYLAGNDARYSVIQMSLIDTWAATGAGAFTLSENTLYTVDGWKTFISRLNDNGIFTVSRWYNPDNLGETGRLVSLAVASLLASETNNPSEHIAMVTSERISTLLLSKRPFSTNELETINSVSSRLGFNVVILPGTPPKNEVLNKIIKSKSMDSLNSAVKYQPFNYSAPTDENPYFFNMLRLKYPGAIFKTWKQTGILKGNLMANLTLTGLILSLMTVAIITILFPLIISSRSKDSTLKPRLFWPAAAYFSLIGIAFMFAEIALVQRMSVFLGHPVYALGVLLFTMILSAGLGSLVSERLPLTKAPLVFIFPVIIAGSILVLRAVLPELGTIMMSQPITNKILSSIVVIFPVGFLLGTCFPTGIKLVGKEKKEETPWYWALNGVFGVLGSALTVFVSIYSSISTSLLISAACYLMLVIFIPPMYRLSK